MPEAHAATSHALAVDSAGNGPTPAIHSLDRALGIPASGRVYEVLAVAGSLRRESYNRRLLETAREHAPANVRVTVYPDLAAVPLFDEDLDAETGGGPEGVARLRAAVAAADGLLISTPEYNQSVPGVLKNAIDWLSLSRPTAVLEGKPVAIMGATSGTWGTRLAQRTLRQVLFATESLVMTGPAVYVQDARRLFDDQGRCTDEVTHQRLRRFLEAFGAWMERMSPTAETKAEADANG